MATFEDSGTLKYKDKAGNLYIMKPRTTSDNVEGLTQLLAKKENSGAAATALENAKAYTDQNISGKLDKPTNDATATAGQLLTKTANGQEWQDREKATFIVTLVGYTEVDKTVAEIKAAKDAGRVCFLMSNRELYPLFAVDDTEAIFTQSISPDGKTIVQYNITVDADGNVSIAFARGQKLIEATGLLKGDGNGNISAAVAGTDYVAPNGDGSNVTAAFTAASTRANVATGEKLSVLFGKIAKWFADLGSLAFKSTVAKSDLAGDVQTSLGKADSALQSAPVTSVNGQTGDVEVDAGGIFWVNITWDDSGYVADKTFVDIKAAILAGKDCRAKTSQNVLVCTQDVKASDTSIVFGCTLLFGSRRMFRYLKISDDESVKREDSYLPYWTSNLPEPEAGKILKWANADGGLKMATAGIDYIASGNIVKQTLVSTETTPTENYTINWVYE